MQLPIMTFNIQHGVDYKKRMAEPGKYSDFELINLPLMAQVIRDRGAVIVGLNEVRDVTPGIEDPCFIPQAKALAEAVGFEYYHFGHAIDIKGQGRYGNGLISKYPFRSIETIMVPDPVEKEPDGKWFETRCMIKAVIEVPDEATGEIKPLTVLVTHMGLNPSEARNAVQTAIDQLSPGQATILMGDFNLTPDSEIIAPLFDHYQDAAALMDPEIKSFPSEAPNIKIDYIMCAGPVKFLKADVPAIVASDHRPHTAEIEF